MSLLLLRDLAWIALLLVFVGLAVLTLAVTQDQGAKTRQDP